MDRVKISIIVPIYNVAKYLEKCILSIMQQTYDKLQIILVDDGSTDDSGHICDEYKEKDNRIVVIHKKNGGLVSARKAGIHMADGEFIGYVDGDDWIEPDMYEHLIRCMEETEADIIESDHYIENEISGEAKQVKSKLGYGNFDASDIIPIMLCDEEFNECRLQPYIWSKLLRKEILEPIQLSVDEGIGCGEDAAVIYPYILKSNKVYISDYAGYHYMQRSNSMTNTLEKDELQKSKRLIRYMQTCFGRSKYADRLLVQLNQYTKLILLLRCISFFDFENSKSFLTPFGGMAERSKVIIYGAGKLGQSIYHYILSSGLLEIVNWLDQEYVMYQSSGMPVYNPEIIKEMQGQYDKIIIAVSSRKAASSIRKYLLEAGVTEEYIIWLSDSFIDEENNILEQLLSC